MSKGGEKILKGAEEALAWTRARMGSVHLLVPGSKWQKAISGKRYEVLAVGIDTTTNNAVVIYKSFELGTVCVRPLGEFMGTVRVADERDEKGGHTYVPRFSPVAD